MNTKLRIATVCQGRQYYPSIQQNRDHVLGLLQLAQAQGAEIVCLPETFATASVAASLEQLAETVPGPTVDAAAQQARRGRSYVICPLLRKCDGAFYNSAVVIGRDGGIVGIYDKIHPVTSSHDYTELERGLRPGTQVPVFDLDFGRIGVQICFDLVFADGWEELARQGARLVFWPSAYNGGMPLQVQAATHEYYVVSSVSQDKSRIIDPCGSILAETVWPVGVILRDINLDYAVCHTDFNPSVPDQILARYPGRACIRPDFDAGLFLLEPTDAELTVAQLQREFGFETRQQYRLRHQQVYERFKAGQMPLPQQAAHGKRAMYVKE